MRDPKRIPRILHKLYRAWNENPDQRLIQLLMNVAGVSGSPEAFYTEDDTVEYGLTKLLDNGIVSKE